MKQARQDTKEALKKAADLEIPTCFEPYQLGDKVWLEGHNLTTMHPTAKLAPRLLHLSFPSPYYTQIHRTAFFLLFPIHSQGLMYFYDLILLIRSHLVASCLVQYLSGIAI